MPGTLGALNINSIIRFYLRLRDAPQHMVERERESNMSTKKLPFVCGIRSFKTNKTNKLTFKDLLSTSCFKLSELE